MINYSRLGYEIRRDFTNFSLKISKGLKRPQEKFIHQMIYGILAGNKLHSSEVARSLKENITRKKTIDKPASRKLEALSEIQDGSTKVVMKNNVPEYILLSPDEYIHLPAPIVLSLKKVISGE